jgi:hypothetical protein
LETDNTTLARAFLEVFVPFDIHARLVDDEGYVDEDAVERYQRELLRLFRASPEAHALRQQGIRLEWTELMLEFALNDLDLTLPQMDDDDLLTILLEYFSGKTLMDVEDIEAVLVELHAFWEFVKREYRLRNARACLRVLKRRTAQRMALAVGGVWLALDDDDEDLELPRWLEIMLDISFRLWIRLRERFGRRG